MAELRLLRLEDLEAVLEVYRDAVLSQARGRYSAAQIQAWAGHAANPEVRQALHARLSALRPERDFGFLLSQRGMFSYTGLSAQQVDTLREQHAVYLIRSGRMCVAGLTQGNVERVAQALAAVF